jgi:type III secretory pathway component EscU
MIFQLTLPGAQINNPQGFAFTDLASVINKLLTYILPLAGIILFFMIIAGGFQLLTSAGNPDSISKGQKKITIAIVGFLVIFIAYWLMQILEVVFGITVF